MALKIYAALIDVALFSFIISLSFPRKFFDSFKASLCVMVFSTGITSRQGKNGWCSILSKTLMTAP
jgi:hypothetical protein